MQPILLDDLKIPNHKFEITSLQDVKEDLKSYKSGDIAKILKGKQIF